MPTIRNKKKLRATNISIRISDEQKAAINYIALRDKKDVADVVAQAVMQVLGKDINAIIREKILQSNERDSSELNRKEHIA